MEMKLTNQDIYVGAVWAMLFAYLYFGNPYLLVPIFVTFVLKLRLFMRDRKTYNQKISEEKVVFRARGNKKLKLKGYQVISIVFFILIIALVIIYKNDTNVSQYSIWLAFLGIIGVLPSILGIDMDHNYKFCEDYFIEPGKEMNKITWDKVESLDVPNKPFWFYLNFQNGEIVKFNLGRISLSKVDAINKFLAGKLEDQKG